MEFGWVRPEALRIFKEEDTTMHRIYSGSEGWVERFGEDYLFSGFSDQDGRMWADQIQAWVEEQGYLIARVFWKQLQQNATNKNRFVQVLGENALPRRTTCRELGMRYQIDFDAGYSNGFFVDQRENRRFLLQLQPRRVLNLFSYTCSFSVIAAKAGAETCSVDVAKKALEWGRENFALNALSVEGHRFMTDDSREVVRRMIKREEKFDVIICDPPTFGRSHEGRVWQIQKDFGPLVEDLIGLLPLQGHILLSSNFSGSQREDLIAMLPPSLTPIPVPSCADLPESEGAKSVWLKK